MMLYVPVGVDDDVEIVMVEPWPEVIGLGLNEGVAPEGRPLALKVTLWAEPLVTLVAMEDVALCPCITLTLLGLVVIVK